MFPTPISDTGRFREMTPVIIAMASNIRCGPNPPYTIEDFAGMYPQFFAPFDSDDDTSDMVTAPSIDNIDISAPVVPVIFLQALIDLAHASVREARFRDAWKMCMGLFIAHFITLYLTTFTEPGATPYELAKAGQAGGVISSKSVDSVSVNYDFSQMTEDLDGWAEWKATAYGLQFATWAKMFSMPGMYVH